MAGRGRPRERATRVLLEKKDDFEKEKRELRNKTEQRVAKAKQESVTEKVWYEKRPDGKVFKYIRMSNGNKFSSLVGKIKDQPGLAKLLEK